MASSATELVLNGLEALHWAPLCQSLCCHLPASVWITCCKWSWPEEEQVAKTLSKRYLIADEDVLI